MTEKEIIEETIEEYSDPNNRALYFKQGGPQDATCRYITSDGKKCAVGRCLTKEGLNRVRKCSRKVKAVFGIHYDNYLKEQYRGHSLDFWTKLQDLHDTHQYWSEEGITEKGVKFVEEKFRIKLKDLEWQN